MKNATDLTRKRGEGKHSDSEKEGESNKVIERERKKEREMGLLIEQDVITQK